MADPNGSLPLFDPLVSFDECDPLNSNNGSYISDEALPDVDIDIFFHRNADHPYFHSDHVSDVDANIAYFDSYSTDFTQTPSDGIYVSPSDLVLDSTLSVSAPDAQLHQSLFNGDIEVDLQRVNNGTNLESTPDVSSHHDTTAGYVGENIPDPVLFGMQDTLLTHASLVEQSDHPLQTPTPQPNPLGVSSQPTERQRRPQVVRNWLLDHAARPYPTPVEKKGLLEATGYTERQLDVCLSNLRTREKHLLHSYANVGSSGGASYPRLCDIASANAVDMQSSFMITAQAMSYPYTNSLPMIETNDSNPLLSSPGASYYTPDNDATLAVSYQDGEAHQTHQAHQAHQASPAARTATMSKRKGRRQRTDTYAAGAAEYTPYATPTYTTSAGPERPRNRFFCTVIGCLQPFKNASDWKRHEAGVHGYGDREWTCMLTEAFKSRAECIFCLEPIDSMDHLSRHAIARCSSKCTIERTFFRKDLLKQHVLRAHLAREPVAVRKNFQVPQEWSREVASSAVIRDSLWCGFCGYLLETNTERMDHVAQHFCNGQDLTEWIWM